MHRWLIFTFLLLAMPAIADETQQHGIFGVVEKLSPLVVAGQQIDVPEDLPTINLLGRGEAVALGDTLALRVEMNEGQFVARRILQIYPIVGPVSKVEGATAVIMGSAIHLPPDVTVKRGQWVAVSGFWSGQKVATTRLQNLKGGWLGHLTGAIDVAAMTLGGSGLRDAPIPKDGFGNAMWMLSGSPEQDGLTVRLISKGLFGGAVGMTLWQGHASLPIASQTYTIHGTGVVGTAPDAQMPEAGALITRCARDGRVVMRAPERQEMIFVAFGCASNIQAE